MKLWRREQQEPSIEATAEDGPPENIELNFMGVLELFNANANPRDNVPDWNTLALLNTEGVLYLQGQYKAAEVRLYLPTINDSERSQLAMLGASSARPTLRLNIGNKDDFDEFVGLIRSAGFQVNTLALGS